MLRFITAKDLHRALDQTSHKPYFWINHASLRKIIIIISFIIALLLVISPNYAAQTSNTTTAQHHKPAHHTQKSKKSHKKKKHLSHQKHASVSVDPEVAQEHSTSVIESNPTTSFATALERRLVQFVHNTVTTLQHSSYRMGGSHVDTNRGVYVVDCSYYVDHILEVVYPNAYSSLVNSTGSDRPTSHHYFDFFNELPDNPHQQSYWSKIDDVQQLRPGDVLVFRSKNARGIETGGHVMVVMDKPIQDSNTFFVRVADSAPSGHSEDTRLPHVSGIGIGTLLIKVNPDTDQPFAYAWKVGSRWKRNVSFAMARPIDFN